MRRASRRRQPETLKFTQSKLIWSSDNHKAGKFLELGLSKMARTNEEQQPKANSYHW
jgi:hypothetical protein